MTEPVQVTKPREAEYEEEHEHMKGHKDPPA
jgi:hypothetical protein